MSFGKRLAEERKRLGLKQAEFAARVGATVPQQSFYENGRRELRAAYLARLPEAGVDVFYVLTGRRGESGGPGSGTSDLLATYLTVSPEMRRALDALVRTLRECFQRPPRRPVGARDHQRL